jgi:hypothetical protein
MKYTYLLLFAVLILGINLSCAEEPKTVASEAEDSKVLVSESEALDENAIHMISPYLYEGEWVFDDERVGLTKEPFVEGIPEMIDELVADIPDAKNGFILYFSDQPMPDTEVVLRWRRTEFDGNWYWAEAYQKEGWLCPALFKYYDKAPEKIYVKAKAKTKR